MNSVALVSRVSSAIIAVGLLASAPARGQAPPPIKARDGIVTGTVTNVNGVPISKAEVLIVSTDLRTVTSDSGTFEFLAAPTGKLRLIARRIGFEPEERSVTLEGNKQKSLDFMLKSVPEVLDSVMVREAGGRGRMADFWARRMTGNGAFITRDEIDRRRPMRASDMLRTVAGVKVFTETGLEHPVIIMGRQGVTSAGPRIGPGGVTRAGECRVTYYLDGNFIAGGTFHLDDVSPLSIEGLEIYRGPAETPPRFRQRDTACGVIAIWTRDPSRTERPPAE